MKAIIETERLLLRPLTLADTDDLAALYADSEAMRFLGGTRSREMARAHIESSLDQYKRWGYCFWATIHKADGRFIGRCGLLPQKIDGRGEAEVAYMIAPSFWGQGFGTEAACAIKEYGSRRFGFPRLVSIISPENIASRRVAQKNGMQYVKEVEFNGHSLHLFATEQEPRPLPLINIGVCRGSAVFRARAALRSCITAMETIDWRSSWAGAPPSGRETASSR